MSLTNDPPCSADQQVENGQSRAKKPVLRLRSSTFIITSPLEGASGGFRIRRTTRLRRRPEPASAALYLNAPDLALRLWAFLGGHGQHAVLEAGRDPVRVDVRPEPHSALELAMPALA